MAAGTSVAGTWNSFVDWGCAGPVVPASPFTFNNNGTWTYQFGGGSWIQVEGLVIFNFNNAPGLIYSANVSRDAVVGSMGYVSAQFSGCFYLIRQEVRAAEAQAEVREGVDVALGPEGTPPEVREGVDVAVGPEGTPPK
jgi:hypothetical protein